MRKKEDNFNLDYVLRSLLAGGVAGMVAKSTVAPLDRLKILLQTQNSHYKSEGVVSGISKIVEREGVLSLFRGNGAQMIRMFPYSAIQFTSFELYKRVLPKMLGLDAETSHSIKFIAGALAGVSAVTCTFPLDLVRARLASQTKGELRYKGIAHTLTSVFKEEGGIRGLYRGVVPTLVGMVPYAGTAFYFFELNKRLCTTYLHSICCYNEVRIREDGHHENVLVLRLPAKFVCGGIAGAFSQTIAYPLDVVRRRMQLAMMMPETQRFGTSTWAALKAVYQSDGVIRGLYRGLSINYLRAIPMVALSFSVNELMKQALNLETGVKVSPAS